MHARNLKARRGQKPSPLNPLSANAAIPAQPAPQAPDNKLSVAFAAALGKPAPRADTPAATVGNDKSRGGSDHPDKTNKAFTRVTGQQNRPGHRSGHR